MKYLQRIHLLVVFLMGMIALNVQAGIDIHYVVNDHLGTPQLLVDEEQNIVWKAGQDAFGNDQPEIEQVEFNIRFPGQYYDKETGTHYNYYRDYDPALGRYLQSDPIGLAGGINTYGYAASNPLQYIDSLGLQYSGIPAFGNLNTGLSSGSERLAGAGAQTAFVPTGREMAVSLVKATDLGTLGIDAVVAFCPQSGSLLSRPAAILEFLNITTQFGLAYTADNNNEKDKYYDSGAKSIIKAILISRLQKKTERIEFVSNYSYSIAAGTSLLVRSLKDD